MIDALLFEKTNREPSALGARGRTFESCHPDQTKSPTYRAYRGIRATPLNRSSTLKYARIGVNPPIESGKIREIFCLCPDCVASVLGAA